MKIIALESSAVTASVAVAEDERLLAQSFQNSGLTHSATLMPMVADLLKNTGLPLEEMDCCRLQHSDECYVLYDKRGRPVIKFSPREDFAPQWMKFLTSHKIKLCSDQGA